MKICQNNGRDTCCKKIVIWYLCRRYTRFCNFYQKVSKLCISLCSCELANCTESLCQHTLNQKEINDMINDILWTDSINCICNISLTIPYSWTCLCFYWWSKVQGYNRSLCFSSYFWQIIYYPKVFLWFHGVFY